MEGRTVLVTGGAKRIGNSIAMKFAEEGASILLHCNNSVEEARNLKSIILDLGCECELFVADLSTREGREKMIQDVISSDIIKSRGGLDVLINSASIFVRKPFKEVSEDDWDYMMEINAKAPYFITKYLLEIIKEVGGCVINMIDTSYERPWPFYSNYCASKSALRSMTLSLARELAPEVRVNGIAPGAILFPDWMPEDTRKDILTTVPMGREGSPEEIAETALFLARGPQYITGQIIAVDGGWSLCD